MNYQSNLNIFLNWKIFFYCNLDLSKKTNLNDWISNFNIFFIEKFSSLVIEICQKTAI